MNPELDAARIYTDFHGLAELRRSARANPAAALPEVARQFEAILVHMMLQSMRDAQLADGIFESDQSSLYTGMFDQQVALSLAGGSNLGVAEMLVQQLGQSSRDADTDAPRRYQRVSPAPAAASSTVHGNIRGAEPPRVAVFASRGDFVTRLRPHAERAAAALGVPADVLLAQAGLETGWGKHIIATADGASTHNLFGIKADEHWRGASVAVASLEFVDGIPQRRQSRFRVYDSYQESFADYVNFVRDNPRYQQALQHTGDAGRYMQSLQAAGYATDPHYADKVLVIMQREFG